MVSVKHFSLITLFAILLLFANLGGPTLWDRDEPRNAGCAQEMLARGDWVVPTFNGELRTHKPVLLYWLTMASYAGLGVSEFSARLPSALLGLGTVLLTYFMALRLFGQKTAILAGCVLTTTLMFEVASRAATPDSLLIFCVTLALSTYSFFVFQRNESGELELLDHGIPTWRAAVWVYSAMGLAVLAKGPVGLVIPTAIIGMFLLVVRFTADRPSLNGGKWNIRLRTAAWLPGYFVRTCWMMRPITAIAACLIVAGPWYVMVGIRTDGAWLQGFFLDHNVGRAAQAMEGHSGSLFYYPVALLAGFFPWSIFALPVLFETCRRLGRREPKYEYLFTACWAVVWIGIFTVARTKLPSYITPVYPAIALLVAAYLIRWSRGESLSAAWWPYWSMAALAAIGLTMAVGLPFAASQLIPDLRWLGIAAVVPLSASIAGILLLRAGRRQWFVATNVCGASLLMLFGFGVIASGVSNHQQSDDLLTGLHVDVDGDIEVASYGILEPSWVFYLREPIWELGDMDHLADEDAQDKYWSPRRSTTPQRFLAMDVRHRVITTATRWKQLQATLPAEVGVLQRAPYFLHDDDLVVIGRTEVDVASRKSSVQR